MEEYEWYCPKCGNIHFVSNSSNNKCIICDFDMIETPHSYNLSQSYMDKILEAGWNENKYLWEHQEQRLFDEIISKSPEFDINLYNNKDSILQQRQQQQEESIARGKAILAGRDKGNKYGVECPYCHATNVKKITNTSKAIHTALFGVFSMSRNSKQWHCNHCNSDF